MKLFISIFEIVNINNLIVGLFVIYKNYFKHFIILYTYV